jgi:polysaccharide biosynthesis/export protein
MRRTKRRSFGRALPLVLLCLSLLFGQSCATTKNPPANAADAKPFSGDEVVKTPTISELILGPGDSIEIQVYRYSDLARKFQIPPDGRISYPWVGDVQAAGTSVVKLRDTIVNGLSSYILDPQVEITVTSLRSDRVYVLGEVLKPGIFAMDTRMTAIDAISAAGGFTIDAKWSDVVLIRGGLEQRQAISLDLKSMLKEGDATQNVPLRSGDILYVPPTYVADVSRFMAHLEQIIKPILQIESAFVLGPSFWSVLTTGKTVAQQGGISTSTTTIVVTPPR